MKANRVNVLLTSVGVRTRRKAPARAAMAVLASCSLTGCAGLFGDVFAGNCAQWEEQPYQHEVCDNRSETGWCTARHWETRTRSVCVARTDETLE